MNIWCGWRRRLGGVDVFSHVQTNSPRVYNSSWLDRFDEALQTSLCTLCMFIQINTFRSLPFVLCTSWQHPSFSISCEQKFPELKFKYVEEDQPEDFFIPYVWSLVFNSGVGLHWSPHGIELFSMDSGWNTCCRRRVSSSPFSIENDKKKKDCVCVCVCVCLCLGGCVRAHCPL